MKNFSKNLTFGVDFRTVAFPGSKKEKKNPKGTCVLLPVKKKQAFTDAFPVNVYLHTITMNNTPVNSVHYLHAPN